MYGYHASSFYESCERSDISADPLGSPSLWRQGVSGIGGGGPKRIRGPQSRREGGPQTNARTRLEEGGVPKEFVDPSPEDMAWSLEGTSSD